jgi:hypothetical protein
MLIVPGSPPQNVRARPVKSNTVAVQWDEPKLPNGVIRVSIFARTTVHYSVDVRCFYRFVDLSKTVCVHGTILILSAAIHIFTIQ